MEPKTSQPKLKMKFLLILFFYLESCKGKILKYDLLNDDRKQVTLSTFGFLQKGTLDVEIQKFSFQIPEGAPYPTTPMFGFTLDKSKTKEVSSYIETMQGKCILNDLKKTVDKSISMVFFTIDHINKKLIIERQMDDVAMLLVTQQDRDSYLEENNLKGSTSTEKRHSLEAFSDASLLHKYHARRAAPKPPTTSKPMTTSQSTMKKTTGTTQQVTSQPPNSQPVTGQIVTSQSVTGQNVTAKLGVVTSSTEILYFPLNETNKVYSGHFLVAIRLKKEEGLYNLFFHNCYNYDHKSLINLSILITEDNNGNFLSAGQMPEPMLFFTFCLLFFLTGCLWLSILKKTQAYKIHFLMLSVVFVKSLSCAFHGVNSYFIKVTGIHEETWAILYYIVYLFKGALMFTTILLIGAGWAFIKHMLSQKEKKLFLIVIPLQVLDQVAWVILKESEEGQVSYTTWKEIFILFDLLCCGAILFPVVWSIRHLQEGSRTDGKAAMNLNKLKLFRQFYILIVCFIYFTRIIVYLLEITMPFRLEWLTQLFNELANLIFFVITGYKFRPADDNPYLQVPQDSDDEMEMDEVLTQTGITEGVVKVNQRYEEKSSTEPLIKQRESSHEYD